MINLDVVSKLEYMVRALENLRTQAELDGDKLIVLMWLDTSGLGDSENALRFEIDNVPQSMTLAQEVEYSAAMNHDRLSNGDADVTDRFVLLHSVAVDEIATRDLCRAARVEMARIVLMNGVFGYPYPMHKLTSLWDFGGVSTEEE